MKEYYISFSVSALCIIPVILMGNTTPSHPINAFAIASVVFFIRGLFLLFRGWLPFPLLGDVRSRFEDEHPEVIGMDISEKQKVFREWKIKAQNTEQGNGVDC